MGLDTYQLTIPTLDIIWNDRSNSICLSSIRGYSTLISTNNGSLKVMKYAN